MKTSPDKMTKKELKESFDQRSSVYCNGVPPWFPEYPYMMELVTRLLSSYFPSKAKIIDLGAGTGNVSHAILEAFDDCHITMLDFSDNMLSRIPEALPQFNGRYSTQKADLFSVKISPSTYNAVVSGFAIHHGRGSSVYGGLYKNIYSWLKTPGVFVCCDVVEGASAEITKLNLDGWCGFMKDKLSIEDIQKVIASGQKEDSPLPLYKHFELLLQAGFSSVDVLWKRYNMCVYTGVKK